MNNEKIVWPGPPSTTEEDLAYFQARCAEHGVLVIGHPEQLPPIRDRMARLGPLLVIGAGIGMGRSLMRELDLKGIVDSLPDPVQIDYGPDADKPKEQVQHKELMRARYGKKQARWK